MEKSGGLPASEHRTVARVMALLELVLSSGSEGLGLGELALTIDAPKSSVHGLVKGLLAAGYFRVDKGRYFPGPAVATLLAASPSVLPSIYHRTLEELAQRWGETSMLAALVGDSLVFVDAVEPSAVIRAAVILNERLSLWPRSAGKCFLAAMSPERLELYLRRNTSLPLSGPQMLDELARVRETGVGYNIGESTADYLSISSLIVNGAAPATFAISIAGPKSRMQDNLDEMAKSVLDAAVSLSSLECV
jgi:DNA-binding IclR family transcriptional regulator